MAFDRFLDSLSFMGIGMLSIIIVIGVLVIAVLLLNLFTGNKVKKSSKIVFVVALCVLILGLSLFNGLKPQITENQAPTEQTQTE